MSRETAKFKKECEINSSEKRTFYKSVFDDKRKSKRCQRLGNNSKTVLLFKKCNETIKDYEKLNKDIKYDNNMDFGRNVKLIKLKISNKGKPIKDIVSELEEKRKQIKYYSSKKMSDIQILLERNLRNNKFLLNNKEKNLIKKTYYQMMIEDRRFNKEDHSITSNQRNLDFKYKMIDKFNGICQQKIGVGKKYKGNRAILPSSDYSMFAKNRGVWHIY